MRKFLFTFLFISMLLAATDSYSQCAMCRRVAETSQTGNSRKGLNAGIMYLLAIPYVLGGIGVYAWYRNKTKP